MLPTFAENDMKHILLATMAALLLGACATNGSFDAAQGMSMGSGLVKNMVDNQCRTELNNRNEWRMAALAMTAQKQREWEDKICGCASEEATQSITVHDMAQMLDANQRTQVVANVTAKTVTSCVRRLMK